jgi:hypothetical protein
MVEKTSRDYERLWKKLIWDGGLLNSLIGQQKLSLIGQQKLQDMAELEENYLFCSDEVDGCWPYQWCIAQILLNLTKEDRWQKNLMDIAHQSNQLDELASEIVNNVQQELQKKIKDISDDKRSLLNQELGSICKRGDLAGWVWDAFCSFSGKPRTAISTTSIGVVYVDTSQPVHSGGTGTLYLELIAGGTGKLYPHPIPSRKECLYNIFFKRDSTFEGEVLCHAQEFLQKQKIWPTDQDIRWYFDLGERYLPAIMDSSWGGAFAIGLWKLLSNDGQLDLDGLFVTASLDSDGNLGNVEGITEKLAALEQSKCRILVVSGQQIGIPGGYENASQI